MRIPLCILGAGMTGLAAGHATNAKIFEASPYPGGICSSYYMRPDNPVRYPEPLPDGSSYRFEVGGGHWIFGGDQRILDFISQFSHLDAYQRRSSVLLEDPGSLVPYPLQYHLGYLDPADAKSALNEMALAGKEIPGQTMKAWIQDRFGKTLGRLFFNDFQDSYTAGLWSQVAPQDYYKNPVDLKLAEQGATGRAPETGYNTTFVYPGNGLDSLARNLCEGLDIQFGKRVVQIDLQAHSLIFEDGERCEYERLISTLPLNKMSNISGISASSKSDPYTSVLVINIGGRKGEQLPDAHWIYVPRSKAGFHRVGIYSNVTSSFLPRVSRQDRTSFYVELAFPGGEKPAAPEIQEIVRATIRELQEWNYLESVEVVDPTWIEVAYTWAWPGSTWREEMLQKFESHDVYMRGRYARWNFQGIAASLREGLETTRMVA